jgi:hypothetical protein
MKFVSEKIARKLFQLGFNEPCIAKYTYASSYFVEGYPMSLYPHTQDFFKGPDFETCCNSHYENGMNANGDIPVICAPDYLTTILWIAEKYRKISLEEDGTSDDWVSCFYGCYLPGEPYDILDSNINEALDEMLDEMLKK